MGITAVSGPKVSYGFTTTSTGGVTEYNEEAGPDLAYLGVAVIDPRAAYNYDPGNAVGTAVLSLLNGQGSVDAVPAISNSSGPTNTRPYAPGTIVSCLAGSTALTALTLNTTVSSATGVWLSQSYPKPASGMSGGTQIINMVCDYAKPWLTFGSAGTVSVWNPANGIARCIAITGSSSGASDASVTAMIAGFDLYGYPQSETITLGASSLNGVIGNKAFKGVQSVTLVGSSQLGSTVINVAFSDKFGFPTRVDNSGYVNVLVVSSNSSTATAYGSSQGIVFASTAAATATTSDIRGTWSSTAAGVVLGGNARLNILTKLSPNNLNTVTATDFSGIFGVTPFST